MGQAARSSTYYVRTNGSDGAPGSSWFNAKRTVQAAINAASSGSEVWVAKGTYTGRITLKSGVSVYGGFAGTESDRSARNWATNVTIMDGNQAGTVVTVPSTASSVCVDGFTIRNGKAGSRNGGGISNAGSQVTIANNVIAGNSAYATYSSDACSGGIYCTNSSATITNNTLTANTGNCCGAIFCDNSSPTITNNTLISNAGDYVGAVDCASSSPTIANNTMIGNSGGFAGGVYCTNSSPTIVNNLFRGNVAGAIDCEYSSSPTISNNLILGNGGFYGVIMSDNTSSPIIGSNTIMANSGVFGGGVYCGGGSPFISNNIIAFNSFCGIDYSGVAPTVRNNDVYGNGGYDYSGPGIGNISVDPMIDGREFGAYHVASTSPCVNTGWADAPGLASTDIDGQLRVQGGVIDIGADESNGADQPAFSRTSIRVSPTGNDSQDGSTWASAKKTVGAACQTLANSGGEIWVKAGVYNECMALPPFVYLYGGFAGTETDRSQRNWSANISILDGAQRTGSVIAARGGHLVNTIDGFTIRNGSGTRANPVGWGYGIYGGGIFLDHSGFSITNNVITANTAGGGGGIECWDGWPLISNNTISANSATNGGGIHGHYLHGTISGNRISANSAVSNGGGAFFEGGGGRIVDNIFDANTAGSGGAVYFGDMGSGDVTNNTIVGNTAGSGGGMTLSSDVSIYNTVVAFNSSGIYRVGSHANGSTRNNNIYANTSYDYSGSASPGVGDISADPLFVNRSAGDYHLTFASPCINAGFSTANSIPTIDMDGQGRIGGANADIGADEYYSTLKDARLAPGGYPANMIGTVVTAAFPDFFYVESDNRTAGIRVNSVGHALTQGMRVDVTGSLTTNTDSERCVDASDAHICAAPNDRGSISPLALPNSFLGGGTAGQQPGVWGWVSSVGSDGHAVRTWGAVSGINNIGLLVTTWGKFTKTGDATFTIDDGSGVNVECVVPSGVTLSDSWTYVAVTGISSCQTAGSEVHRLLRVRDGTDIVRMQ